MNLNAIRVVDAEVIELSDFSLHLADCVVLTHDHKILLQQRPLNWESQPGSLTTFGGHVEEGENVTDGLIRELHEELGAVVLPEELTKLGAITEDFTQHKELVHVYFWHDRKNTITGCYEAEARQYHSVNEVLLHPQIMDYVRWALQEAQNKGLLK